MLQREIDQLARRLGEEVLATFRRASPEELLEILPGLARALRSSLQGISGKGGEGLRPGRPSKSAATSELADSILRVLKDNPHGLRSEDLQRNVEGDAPALRKAIAELLETGKVVRKGQARGTRYFAVAGARVSRASSSTTTTRTSPKPKTTTRSSGVTSAETVTTTVVMPLPASIALPSTSPELERAELAVREFLASSPVPASISELEVGSSLPRSLLKLAIASLERAELVERTGQGASTRYQLSTHRAASSGGPPRLVRRAPLAKDWKPASEESTEREEPTSLGVCVTKGHEGAGFQTRPFVTRPRS